MLHEAAPGHLLRRQYKKAYTYREYTLAVQLEALEAVGETGNILLPALMQASVAQEAVAVKLVDMQGSLTLASSGPLADGNAAMPDWATISRSLLGDLLHQRTCRSICCFRIRQPLTVSDMQQKDCKLQIRV